METLQDKLPNEFQENSQNELMWKSLQSNPYSNAESKQGSEFEKKKITKKSLKNANNFSDSD